MTRKDLHVKECGRRKISFSSQVLACMMLTFCHQPSGAFTSPYGHANHRYFHGSVRCYHRENVWRRSRQISASYMATSGESSSDDGILNDYEWKVGNVYDNLDRLQQEIAISQADQHLRQVEDRERLDTFAAQRRPIQRDVRRFLLAPLFLSVFLTLIQKSHAARFFTLIFNLHFYFIVVAAPICLLLAKRKSLPPPPPPPKELRGLDPDYYRFVVTDWEDPKTSCRDHVLCLLENWTSAVMGPALLACIYYLLPWTASRVTLAAAGSQLITRLGAIAALYQYPKLLFQLRRHHQPHPMDRYTMRLQQLTWLALAAAPFGVASDLAQVMNQLPPRLVASFLGLGLTRFCKHHLWRGTAARPLTRRAARRQSLVGTVLSLAQLTAMWNLVAMVARGGRLPMMPSYTSLGATAMCQSLLAGPICHLVAIRKLVRVSYTHDLSLANDYDTISTILSDPIERQKRFKWRYRLEWREPERILHTLSKWKGGFSYWLLFQGGVEDQLRKEFQAFQKGAAHRQGLTVLQRCEQEMRENPDAPRPNSRLWKQKAMEKLAAKHEKEYQSGAYEDPLGVAVQQTFGIGLGYEFDHMTELKEGERPSARRLQARAAKSAIKRAQEIYDAAAAQKELDSIKDPKERSRKQAAMRRATEAELAYIASTLSELIPTDLRLDSKRRTKIQQFVKRHYKPSSSHEIIVESPIEESSSLNSLFGRPDDTETDEEFVEAWLNRQQEDDGDDSTVLV